MVNIYFKANQKPSALGTLAKLLNFYKKNEFFLEHFLNLN